MSDSSDSSSPSRVRRRRRRDRRRRSSSVSSSRSPRRSPSRRSSRRPLFGLLLLWEFALCPCGRNAEPVRSPLRVPQPLCSSSVAIELPPRPDPAHHAPVVVSQARMPLCPFMPSCRLPQFDLTVLPVAASCAQAFSIFSLCAFDAMSRIGGLHPLRQLARLTGATGAPDPNSSGSGPAPGATPAAAPDTQPSDGAAVAAPAATGGDGSAGPAAAATAPAHDGTDGDGAAAPPAPISKSSGAAFLAPPPGPTPKTPPAKVSSAPPARSSLSSGIDIRDPNYRPSFPQGFRWIWRWRHFLVCPGGIWFRSAAGSSRPGLRRLQRPCQLFRRRHLFRPGRSSGQPFDEVPHADFRSHGRPILRDFQP